MQLPHPVVCSLSVLTVEDKGFVFSLIIVPNLVDIICPESYSVSRSASLTSILSY